MKKIMTYLFILIITAGTGFAQEPLQFPELKLNVTADSIIKKTLGSTQYKVTPGDVYQLVIGVTDIVDKRNTSINLSLVVSDKNELELPYLGKLNVKDMYYYDLRDIVLQKLKTQLSAYYINFSLVSPGLFDVFVYGAIKIPGFTTVTSLSRVSDAIVLAGSIEMGSYRTIRLIRKNQTLTLDLLKYFNEGDLSQNPLVESGDKIFIPAPQLVCQIEGMTLKPGKYEMIEGDTLQDLFKLCGGIIPGGSMTDIWINRIDEADDTHVFNVKYADAGNFKLKNGDMINIKARLENKRTILVEGALYSEQYKGTGVQTIPTTPVVFNIPYIPGLTLLSVLESTGGLTPFADAEKSLIIRDDGNVKIPVNVKQLWEQKDKKLDVSLQSGDHVYIPIQKLKVVVAGYVNSPGTFPYTTETDVGEYLLLAGGVNPETGSLYQIFRLEPTGRREMLGLDDFVEPGTLIYVDKNSWTATTDFLGQVGIVVGFATAVVTLVTGVVELIQLFN